ncbi:MAG: hypothetical protein NMNS01_09610 [Nitrosomonas sp.]|nr:MAG: hypothetical protein NMNS01_09610 [Nitrosomonas sp.]
MDSKLKMTGFFLLSLAWLGFAYQVGQSIPDQQLWFAVFATLLFGLPLYLATTYAVTVRKIHYANQFRNLGILHWLLTRRLLAYVGWLLWSITFAYLLLLYLGTAKTLEWFAFIMTVPVFAIVHAVFTPITAQEYKPYMAAHKTLIWARWATALVMAVFYVFLVRFIGGNHQYTSLAQAIEMSEKVDGASNSVLVLETTRLLGILEGFKNYALSSLHTLNDGLYLLLVFIGSLMLFYHIALAFSSFMLSIAEYRRVLGPIQDSDQPPRIPPRSLAIASAFITFFVLFIIVPTTIYLDGWLHASPKVVEHLRKSQNLAIDTVEMVENEYYKPGTIAQTAQAYLDIASELDASINELMKASDIGFQRMAANVDDYLDWYYSLTGEYARIAALATGVLEKQMIEKLESYLMKNNAFDPIQQSIDDALKKNQQLRTRYLERVDHILTENRVQPTTAQVDVTRYSPLDALKDPPSHSVIVNLENRLLLSGGAGAAGAVSGAIAGKVTAKVVGKGTIKLGAQALIKVTAGKAVSALGGAAAGAASGAAIGSVVPGAGTALGAAVGGVIGGIAVGVTVEKLLLMLEESFSREEFKRQILEAIEEARLEFNESLQPDI